MQPPRPHEVLEADLDRLARLLEGPGREPFLRRPIVRPNATWFPDRWQADLESARCLVLRLMAYSGLADLEAEVLAFRSPAEGGVAAMFRGIEAGRARFAVDVGMFDQPDILAGVLAHEVAHAWRHTHALALEDRNEEEQLTDLTTVVLGLGILSANAAYHYESSGIQVGIIPVTRYVHQVTGYVGPERLARMLAVQCVVRGEDHRAIRRCLRATPADAFDTLLRVASQDELLGRLGLTRDDVPAEPAAEAPEAIVIPAGPGAVAVHACAVQLVNILGEAGGILPEPLPITISPALAHFRALGTWGRPHRDGGWQTDLVLVEDPEWDCELIVRVTADRGTFSDVALGILTADRTRDARHLRPALEPLFTREAHARAMAPELPSFVLRAPGGPLGIDDLRALLNARLQRLDAAELARDVEAFAQLRRSWTRVEQEHGWEPGFPPGTRFDAKPLLARWWEFASTPETVADELSTWRACNLHSNAAAAATNE